MLVAARTSHIIQVIAAVEYGAIPVPAGQGNAEGIEKDAA